MSQLYVGLMSGTSIDSIDAVIADFKNTTPSLVHSYSAPIAKGLKRKLEQLCQPGDNEIDLLGETDRQLGVAFAQATLDLLKQANIASADIQAIGSHGQTIRHRPPASNNKGPGFTLQIGDPNTIAELTGITTVADFRRRDIAAGGQGAPLAPAFHREVFGKNNTQDVAVINIGGIANISLLKTNGQAPGFDTGPGNRLLDDWIQRSKQLAYDDQGNWARSGQANTRLLAQLLQHDFFQEPVPKSTGREDFNLAWLEQQLARFEENLEAEDVQATLVELTATSIANAIHNNSAQLSVAYICGGGARNTYLLQRLQALLKPTDVSTTAALGMDPEWVEAIAFAWLAQQTLSKKPGNRPEVTGAAGQRILGGIYPA